MRLLMVLIMTCLCGNAGAHAGDGGSTPCATPQLAARTFVDGLSARVDDPAVAATCFADAEGGEHTATMLKQVLDARGLRVQPRALPTERDYVDESGAAIVPLVKELDQILIVRDEVGWRFPPETTELVAELYTTTFSPLSEWFQSQLPPWFGRRLLGIYPWQVCYAALLFLVAWGTGSGLRFLLRTRLRRGFARMGLELDEETWQRTNAPMVTLVVLAVLYWGLPDLQLNVDIAAPVRRILWVLVWIFGVVLAFRSLSVVGTMARLYAATTDSKLDDQVIPLLRQVVQTLVAVVGILYIADAAGFEVWKLAAGVGLGGLAFALAAQETVANLFGSINIFLDKPFQIGDLVRIGDVEGVVEEVGLRSTRVRTLYNSLVSIPNSQITGANVDNLGVRAARRVRFNVGVTYDTPPDLLAAFVAGIRAILAANPRVHDTYEAHVHEFGASSVDVIVAYHVDTSNWTGELETRAQVVLEMMRLAKEIGVSFAFPSSSVYVESTPDRPLAERNVPDEASLRAIFDGFGPKGAKSRPAGPTFVNRWSVADVKTSAELGASTTNRPEGAT